MGNGHFVLNTDLGSNHDYMAKELSKELTNTVKKYFEVYPFAKDGLDILFLYCNSFEAITRSVESLFKQVKRFKEK
ncbi:hypothetical protein [Thalassobacillus sp. C254]|uniref:hypothetical protein n=1 Tax=Thalassobacillus sp. C254 TaxID=1225341 RepID=UPI0006D076D2|nr:hypothetical protein [Thalassobacillus sp. C254]